MASNQAGKKAGLDEIKAQQDRNKDYGANRVKGLKFGQTRFQNDQTSQRVYNQQADPTYKGLYNLQGIMNSFYKDDAKDDSENRAIKNTFRANMVQSAFDASQSRDLMLLNQSIASGAMVQAADLERRNQAQSMKDEFDYGMQKMGAEYDFQSRFAADSDARKVVLQTNAGNIAQNQAKVEGEQNRLNLKEQGNQSRKGMIEQGNQERQSIAAKGLVEKGLQTLQGTQAMDRLIKSGEQQKDLTKLTGIQALDQIGAKGKVEQSLVKDRSQAAINQIIAQGQVTKDITKLTGSQKLDQIKTSGDEERKNIKGRGEEQRAGIRETGSEERKNIIQRQVSQAADRKDQSNYSRALAQM